MRSITSRPRALSRRRPDAVIDPSGNASTAAALSLSGVFGSACVGSVRSDLRAVMARRPHLHLAHHVRPNVHLHAPSLITRLDPAIAQLDQS
jgi:hypothetical protein